MQPEAESSRTAAGRVRAALAGVAGCRLKDVRVPVASIRAFRHPVPTTDRHVEPTRCHERS